MKSTITIKGLIVIFCMMILPRAEAANGKPFTGIKMNYMTINRVIADTTLPTEDKKNSKEKASGEKEENTTEDKPVEVVKVIPNARRQPIPVPVKVNVKPVKIIKPKIIKSVVKPVIKILH